MEDVSNKIEKELLKASIFRIGEVFAVNGREISIKVDTNKNLSHLIYCGELIKSVSVGSYVKIQKGFIQLVGKVESEQLKESKIDNSYHNEADKLFRILIVKLIGYFDNGQYNKGIKELPLIGDTCYLMDNEEFSAIHRFANRGDLTLRLGHLMADENVPIQVSINKLFASHIGIFGNTGSGKSHTLASLYGGLFDVLESHKSFKNMSHFVLFDFNGEYSSTQTITNNKRIFNLIDDDDEGDKIPFALEDLIRIETLSILSDATEKTQKPFIRRTIDLYHKITAHEEIEEVNSHFKNYLKKYAKSIFLLRDSQREIYLLDLVEQILKAGLNINEFYESSVFDGLEIYSNNGSAKIIGIETFIKADNVDSLFDSLTIGKMLKAFSLPDSTLQIFIIFLYLRLISDVVENRANNEHIAPVIRRIEGLMSKIPRILDIGKDEDIFKEHNIVVINLNNLTTELKKLLPLIISAALYRSHKKKKTSPYLNLIIDEAHNILSTESKRETENWKDYRLETFEEIIKEGRKFGVFLTLSSQRPSDISPTIISQLHNYFIHRLVNNKDIDMIDKAVSYLDKVSLESLPILPVGACILSGLIADLPIVLQVEELPKDSQPKSQTIKLTDHWLDT